MVWNRNKYGAVAFAGLIHLVYIESKYDARFYWTSQCGLQWADRDNTNSDRAPRTVKRRVNCVQCLYLHLKHGWPL